LPARGGKGRRIAEPAATLRLVRGQGARPGERPARAPACTLTASPPVDLPLGRGWASVIPETGRTTMMRRQLIASTAVAFCVTAVVAPASGQETMRVRG